jgi:hypothetical protein
MIEMTACCGLDCAVCPAFIATKNNDEELRIKTAALWSKEYGANISPKDVHCSGCTTEGKKFHHCEVCEIRKCCAEKNIENCAFCPEYACKKIIDFFGFVPDAKLTLDRIKESIK